MTSNAAECDIVVTGRRSTSGASFDVRHPLRHATYKLADHGHPTLEEALEPFIQQYHKHLLVTAGVDDYAF